jgi:hypothetical protein
LQIGELALMELLLNLVWLTLAILLSGTWLCISHVAAASKGPHPVRTALSVICILALLFPVVSISDDLYAAGMAAEAVSVEQGNGKHHVAPSFLASGGAVWLFTTTPKTLTKLADDETYQVCEESLESVTQISGFCRIGRDPPDSSICKLRQMLQAKFGGVYAIDHSRARRDIFPNSA